MKLPLIALLLLIVLTCHSQPASPTCLVDNGLCNYNLSDTSTSLPFDSVKQNLGISYRKYNAAPAYPGDVTQGNNDDGCLNNDDCGSHPHQ